MSKDLQLTQEQILTIIQECFDDSYKVVFSKKLQGGVLNAIYRVDINNGSQERQVVLKMYSDVMLDPNATASRQEIHQLQMQAFDKGGPVPKVHGFIDDFDGHSVLIMDYIRGDLLEEVDQISAYQLGQTIARWHQSTKDVPPFQKKPNDFLAFASELWQSFKRGVFSDSSIIDEYHYLHQLIRYAVGTLYYPSVQPLIHGLVHGDIHPGNVMVNEEGHFTLLDFELCYHGPIIKDLANAICMFCFNPNQDEDPEFSYPLMSALLSGFNQVINLKDEDLAYLPTALKDRANLEEIANLKLELLGKPHGSAFDDDHKDALLNALLQWPEQPESLLTYEPARPTEGVVGRAITPALDATKSSMQQKEDNSHQGSKKKVSFQVPS